MWTYKAEIIIWLLEIELFKNIIPSALKLFQSRLYVIVLQVENPRTVEEYTAYFLTISLKTSWSFRCMRLSRSLEIHYPTRRGKPR